MEIFTGLLNWIVSNPAFSGVIGAWVIYRVSKNQERNTIIASLEKELGIHKNWMNGEYTDGLTQPSWKDKNYVVFKLSTVAIDNAISQGSGLFINKGLIEELLWYRQLVEAFNQLVDAQQMFQSNTELWLDPTDETLVARMIELTRQIHTYGIGSSVREQSAHKSFKNLNKELREESTTKVFWLFWFLSGINLHWLKKYI